MKTRQRIKATNMSHRIDPQLKADIELLAKATDRSAANYLQRILREHVEAEKKAGRFPSQR
jgi:predicted transcriptional regulator